MTWRMDAVSPEDCSELVWFHSYKPGEKHQSSVFLEKRGHYQGPGCSRFTPTHITTTTTTHPSVDSHVEYSLNRYTNHTFVVAEYGACPERWFGGAQL